MGNIEKVIELVLREANDLEQAAGFSGSHTDGGASRLRDQVRFYKMGAEGVMPSEWSKYELTLDEDYETWQRLNKKFKGKV